MTKTSASDVKKARVQVEIDGEEHTLIPSPEAILILSAKYDGLQPLNAAIGRVNVHAIADVVIAGLGLENAEARAMLRAVATSDIIVIGQKASQFVNILANGGRAVTPAKPDDKEGDGPLSA